MGSGTASTTVLGREHELHAIQRFFDGRTDSTALVIAGDAGVGKTTLWEAAAKRATQDGWRVLQARASGAETRLSFVTLSDLLDEVERDAFDGLPGPQRRALEVALFEDEPAAEPPPEARAVAVGLLAVLRRLASEQPLVLAVDDIQWLDEQTAEMLSFVARRLLRDRRVLFLLAERTDAASTESQTTDLPHHHRIDLGPLSAAAIRRLLQDRLNLSVPRRLMSELMATCGGNPLFALEVGRALQTHGLPKPGERLATPAGVEELLKARVEALPDEVEALVLATALSPLLTRAELSNLANETTVDRAIDENALAIERDRVRLAHPLLGPAALSRATQADLKQMHRDLANAATDEVRKAHHLAHAADREDATLATTLDEAAHKAASRGAVQDAAELSEQALRLTPNADPKRAERVLSLADHLLRAGRDARLTAVLDEELPSLPPGRPRVRAHLLLNEGGLTASTAEHMTRIGQALEEAQGDDVLAAPAKADEALTMAIALVQQIPEAERRANEAAEAAPQAGIETERHTLRALAWTRAMAGKRIDDVAERFTQLHEAPPHTYLSVARVQAVQHGWRGELREARQLMSVLLRQADEEADAWSSVAMRLHLCEVELRAGEWPAAGRMLDAWEDEVDDVAVVAPLQERCRALLAAGRGDATEAERRVVPALARAEAVGVAWDRLEAWRARGLAALAARDAEAAATWLGKVWQHTVDEGIGELGAFPVAPDLVEALTELERATEADEIAERLATLAAKERHPWADLGARRCRALLAFHHHEDAGPQARAVADEYAQRGLRFDAARTLLALGRVERRRRQWANARDALSEAVTAFEAQDAPGWAEQARDELSRVGGRRKRADDTELTPAERRVVELAAAGHANKAIAATLVVSINTVEGHLTRAYAKLGVRSRAELATKLAAKTPG